jgi:type I restriction enzyme S subunit
MSDVLPHRWVAAPVAEVIEDFQPGFASGEKNVVGGVAHLRMNNIGLDGKLVLDLVRTVPTKLAKPRHDLSPGDVLICSTNSSALVGKCAYFDLKGRYAFSNHLTRLRPKRDVVDGRFLRWNLWLHWKRGVFDDKCKHWVNQSTLPKDELLENEVVLPPLAEQRRIVAKLETLLGKVDASQQRLAKIPVLLKRFRQSVLAAACSGRLTADWRKENGDARVSDSLRQRAVKGDDDDSLPPTWISCQVGDVMTLKNGFAFKSVDYRDAGVPLVRISNIQDGNVGLDDCAKLPLGKADWNFAVEKGDLLVAMSGATTGKFGIYQGDKRCLQNQRVGNVKILDAREVLPGFRNIALQSLKRRIEEDAYGGAQPNISPAKIEALPFACPPQTEQQEIVRRVEGMFALADQIEARFEKARAHAKKLTPSLLARAFRGELVPQDPNDEPASVLLERIKNSKDGDRSSKPRKRAAISETANAIAKRPR